MIEQIRDLLKAIESNTSQNKKIKYSIEVCRLVLENSSLDEAQYKSLEAEDMTLDTVLSIDEIVKYTSNFLEHSLKYLEADLKGSEFEIEIEENSKLLQKLHSEFTSSSEKYRELNDRKKEVAQVQSEIADLQRKIDEYAQVDLEKMNLEKEQMAQRLIELEETEGHNLKIYRRHLEENKKLDVFSKELSELSLNVNDNLKKMDKKLQGIKNG